MAHLFSCKDCPYCYKTDEDQYPCCQYPGDAEDAPCEELTWISDEDDPEPADDLEHAREAIREYIRYEFDCDDPELGPDRVIGVAYTTTEDGEHDIQWYVDIVGLKEWLEVDGVFAKENSFESLEDIITKFNSPDGLWGEYVAEAEDWIHSNIEEV